MVAAAAAAAATLLPSHIWSCSHYQSPKLNPSFPLCHRSKRSLTLTLVSSAHTLTPPEPPPISTFPQTLLRFAASAALLLGLGLSCCVASAHCSPLPVGQPPPALHDQATDDNGNLESAFETWKSKTYALTVPLTVAALRGSVPPSWIKDFMQSQGKRSKLQLKSHASLEGVFSELSIAFSKGNVRPSSVAAADVVSIGDSWLGHAINKGLIEPIQGVEDQDWYKGLSDRWKVYLRRNSEGRIDPDGKIWAAPYRWGCIVIAYKKTKFRKHNVAPITDWADLWRPELSGRISMIDSPREVIGAVLKHMGTSYNTQDIHLQVDGGRDAVRQNLASLGKQVRLFDSAHYLKAFAVGDVWVAVGWSSDVLPVAKRVSDVAVIVPKSGTSIWADMWATPAVSRLETNQIGGRVRGPSPLIHQWIDFCLQTARAIPFKQEVIPGASPSALDSAPAVVSEELTKGKPRLDTNLIAGVPPPEILARCEFLEPLSDSTLSDYQWLIDSMQKSKHGLVPSINFNISSLIQNLWLKLHAIL
ncbi:PREDICTED: uncharacterized protein LOC101297520 [Fragaria vesca subsp. vesca]|uniref:uncharacterized protein LOC101297520 n=1 Tax=Fragaria vesca subsp. vesca TaxID=101020 RepID=UPI0002C355C1|nr:PREDICTED: uncharacterized protein LOC101297520 [Fragaria vesca subsp. vesca]XP_011461582.1 PREDICTED: uncharacterized protein LOC101297520 [Fragaria vesca subsp. vesca]